MKIIHITTGYNHGGGAIACKRLVEAQRSAGIDARIITQEPGKFPDYVYTTTNSWLKKKLNIIKLAWEKFVFLFKEKSNEGRFQYSLANSGENITRLPALKNADIIHLHWINGGFISLKGLKKIIQTEKPIVWTMHDIWAFTGGCHIADNCTGYKTECLNCFYLKNRNNTTSLKQQKIKKKIYSAQNLFFIAPSNWQKKRAESSLLLRNKNIQMIHNAISLLANLPEKTACRNELSLPENKKLILFGAFNTQAKHKGMSYLIDALCQLGDKNDTELLIFGKPSEALKQIPLQINYMGYVADEMTMRKLYSAADIFVTPSIEDNLPNTILESFTCGTPVVAFQTGGIPEIIDHKKNGYLAEFKNTNDLANGIDWCLKNNTDKKLSTNAIHKIESHFNYQQIGNNFKKFYRQINLQKQNI